MSLLWHLTDKVHDYREQPIKDIPALASTSLFIFISVDIVAPVASVFLKMSISSLVIIV